MKAAFKILNKLYFTFYTYLNFTYPYIIENKKPASNPPRTGPTTGIQE